MKINSVLKGLNLVDVLEDVFYLRMNVATQMQLYLTMLCTIHVFHTIRVWYIPYAYGTYHTRMVCFSVSYVYGCTVCIYVSHSIKLFYRDWRFYAKSLLSLKSELKGYYAWPLYVAILLASASQCNNNYSSDYSLVYFRL